MLLLCMQRAARGGVGQTMATPPVCRPGCPTLRADVIGDTAGQWRQETPVGWLFTAELQQATKSCVLLYREDESTG